MRPRNEQTIVEIWPEPAPMESGAPEPALVREGELVWVAYRAQDPGFPGYEHPGVIEYMDTHPGESFAVLRFDGVVECSLGPPNEDHLHEHPLYGRGLKFYGFHRVRWPGQPGNRWIVTFHDETLDIRAKSARAFPMRFASSQEEAIALARSADQQ
jgi:hypothetical protein